MPEDGRATNAVLTEAGWAKTVATAPGHVEAVRSLVTDAVAAPQLEQLTGACLGILGRIDAVDP
ncbi:hypothetical protein [Streptomyces sp. NPDC093984]|uniref:hypothetical protein n=1 Tax=Streptomyces sp. NPDC093984 TaxID=3366052 RepID=UPI0038174BDC